MKRRRDLSPGESFQESVCSAAIGVRDALAHSERVASEIYSDMRGLSAARVPRLDERELEAVIRAFSRGDYVIFAANPPSRQHCEGGVSSEQLHAIMPSLSHDLTVAYLPLLNAAMLEAKITTPLRQAAFLAQLAHESGELRAFHEFHTGDQYEGRKDIGNTQPGDGRRFKGRGPIQVTGRATYRAAGSALGLPLEDQPELVATPEVGFRVAGWFWTAKHLDHLADARDFDGITHRVNGGFRGKASRDHYYGVAKRVLGVPEP
ncbi:MAG: hypothetical protein M3O36_15990 [Myxococcota bacterium]|nr:hypothetical protein [Myxococcota bacterium]